MLHLHLDQCESTQKNAQELFESGESEILVSCERQSSGVGRRERHWFSAQTCMALSFTIKPCAIRTLTSLELGILSSDFLKERFDFDSKLKWPNDIYSPEGKKCGGILIKSIGQSLIAGIGINLYHPPEEIPKDLIGKFTPVLKSNPDLDMKDLSLEFYRFIKANRMPAAQIRERWLKLCIHFNKEVLATEDGEIIQGVFHDIGEFGEAILKTKEGVARVYNATLDINP